MGAQPGRSWGLRHRLPAPVGRDGLTAVSPSPKLCQVWVFLGQELAFGMEKRGGEGNEMGSGGGLFPRNRRVVPHQLQVSILWVRRATHVDQD